MSEIFRRGVQFSPEQVRQIMEKLRADGGYVDKFNVDYADFEKKFGAQISAACRELSPEEAAVFSRFVEEAERKGRDFKLPRDSLY